MSILLIVQKNKIIIFYFSKLKEVQNRAQLGSNLWLNSNSSFTLKLIKFKLEFKFGKLESSSARLSKISTRLDAFAILSRLCKIRSLEIKRT